MRYVEAAKVANEEVRVQFSYGSAAQFTAAASAGCLGSSLGHERHDGFA